MLKEIIVNGKDGWEIYKTPEKYYHIFAYNKDLDMLAFLDDLTDNLYSKSENVVCDLKKLHISENIDPMTVKCHLSVNDVIGKNRYLYNQKGLFGYIRRKNGGGNLDSLAVLLTIKIDEIGLSNVKVKLFGGKDLIRLDFKNEDQIAQFNFYFGQYFSMNPR